MALTDMAFDPATGLLNTSSYVTAPVSETAARTQIQGRLNELRDYINTYIVDVLNSVTNGAAGADNIGMTVITETGANATVQSIVEALITRLKAVTDSASGADLIGATVITETGAAATVQAIIEALVTRLKAVTDSASGADLVGMTAISGWAGATPQAILESAKADYTRLPGYAVDTGVANAYVVTLDPAPTAYVDGMRFYVKLTHANTSVVCSLNVNELGAKRIYKNGTINPNVGDLLINSYYEFVYNSSLGFIWIGGDTDAVKLNGVAASGYATAAQGTKADAALPDTSYTAADVLAKIKTVDGVGSGLDADTLDTYAPASARTANTLLLRDASGNGAVNGISFPAAQSASADANTLDDYEEGTWTPQLGTEGTDSGQTETVIGWYVKIGKVVTVGFDITATTLGTLGGSNATIKGLPFVTNGTIACSATIGICIGLASNVVSVGAYCPVSVSRMFLTYSAAASVQPLFTMPKAILADGLILNGFCTYYV